MLRRLILLTCLLCTACQSAEQRDCNEIIDKAYRDLRTSESVNKHLREKWLEHRQEIEMLHEQIRQYGHVLNQERLKNQDNKQNRE